MITAHLRLASFALLVAAWQTTTSASAQERHEVADVMRANLEPSYLVVPIDLAGLDPVWYEASVVAHFVAYRPEWPLAVVLSPKIVVRLFQAHSDPVKTPSYMPRLALFWWLDEHGHDRAPLRYLSFAVHHHSNGQAGPTLMPGRKLNHDDGDFFTNGLEVALHAFEPTRPIFRWIRVAFDWQPWFVQQADIDGRYGSARLQLDATALEQPSIGGSLHVSLGAILDGFQHNGRSAVARQLERFPLSVAYSLAFEGSEVALFARYYVGRDYYNIWFDRTVHVLQLGISSHVAPLLGGKP